MSANNDDICMSNICLYFYNMSYCNTASMRCIVHAFSIKNHKIRDNNRLFTMQFYVRLLWKYVP